MKGFVKRWLGDPGDAPSEKPTAEVGKGKRVYCIGDVHGRADLLQELHAMILDDAAGFDGERSIVYLGDLIDRGMNSREVIELLLEESLPEFEAIYLMGNHERTFVDFMEYPEQAAGWLAWGGRETVLSYGISAPPGLGRHDAGWVRDELLERVPKRHVGFLSNMRSFHLEGDYLFVHAGIRPRIPLQEQSDSDLLWIRQEFLESNDDHGCVVVHGHTISDEVVIRPNRIGIDTGAYASGVLTCMVLERSERRFLQTGRAR